MYFGLHYLSGLKSQTDRQHFNLVKIFTDCCCSCYFLSLCSSLL